MPPSILASEVAKCYVLRHVATPRYQTLRDSLAEGAARLLARARHAGRDTSPPKSELFWALQDINLRIGQGERIGIIGRNGAGKSTLLKLLSRITSPTRGEIRMVGRVASLLEVGTGFHPELTGRENIFLNGAILGMTRAEIVRKFDAIVAFSEVERFLDTPVKRYSSGMYVRLAFAVAAHLEPEILIVDEVLAVGDSQFQKKCLGKMKEVGAEGRTVLFVSHNMAAIRGLCDRGVLLQGGRIGFDGPVDACIEAYQSLASPRLPEALWSDEASAPGNEFVSLRSIMVKPSSGNSITIDSGIEIDVEFRNLTASRSLDFTLYLHSSDGVCLFETGIIISEDQDAPVGLHRVRGVIPPHLLNSGTYRITLVFGEKQRHVLCKLDEIATFDVEHTATGRGWNMHPAPGVIRPILQWRAEYLREAGR